MPASLDDLADPAYADLLVVQNPATSSPGLAFLLATIDEYGADGWQAYWQALVDNGVEVVDGWTQAYYERFSAAGGRPEAARGQLRIEPARRRHLRRSPETGARSSRPASDRSSSPASCAAPTRPDEARQLVDFLVGETFQSELALNLFVYPANADVELPPEFVEAAVIPDDPHTLDPADIDANRSTWIDEWTELVIG